MDGRAGRTIALEWDDAERVRGREMLAEFEVRVVFHARTHSPCVAITGMEISLDVPEMAD
jgi:hypothetical protein